MKTSIILSALASILMSSAVYASDVKIPESKTSGITKDNTELALEAEAAAYFEEIETYYEANFEVSLDEIVNPVKHVVVYDAQGNIIVDQAASAQHAIPSGADLLMTDGDTAYYIVLN